VIGHLTPLFASEKGNVEWHPLARKILDDFGELEEVRNSLCSNLYCFASGGSRAPYYQRRIELLSQLSMHLCPKVQVWANALIKELEKERDEAARVADEWEWGIH